MEQYEVYEVINNKKKHICLCKEYKMALYIVKCLAYCDAKGDTYYFTDADDTPKFVIGGGWYVSVRKDLKTGKLIRADLD